MYHKFNTNLIMIASYHVNSFVTLGEPFVSLCGKNLFN